MPQSRAQVRLAYARLGGKAKHSRMSDAVAREIVTKTKGQALYELPERTKPKKLFRRKK